MFKRLLAAFATLALTLGLVALVASPASAHDHNVVANCSSGLTVTLTNYHVDHSGDTPNTVTVVVDGQTVVNKKAFGSSFVNTYAWTVVPSASHRYSVSVQAVDDPTGSNNWTFDTGTQTLSGCSQSSSAGNVGHTDPYCAKDGTVGSGGYTIPNVLAATYTVTINGLSTVKPAGTYSVAPGTVVRVVATPTSPAYVLTGTTLWNFTIKNFDSSSCAPHSDASASVTISSATCATGQTVQLGSVVNAAWGSLSGATGPGTYTVTATAKQGHVFSGGGTTKTFSGQLTGPLPSSDPSCKPSAVCIPNSAVSYTYDPATNSGIITVQNVPNSTGSLCNPFWVTATSWRYTTGTSPWPQVRDVVQKLPKISSVGVYHYAAAMNCGQGDIYASFSAQPDPTPTLIGPGNPFSENFLSQMGFNGPTPTYTQQALSCYTIPVTVAAPTFAAAKCDTSHPGQTTAGSYTIPDAVAGVSFVLKGTNTPLASGAHAVNTFPSTVDIVAVIASGYSAPPNTTTEWTYTFASPGDCLSDSKVVTPTTTQESCVTSQPGVVLPGGYELSAVTGLQYQVTVNSHAPFITSGGSYAASAGDVIIIQAQALTGYKLVPDANGRTSWTFTFTAVPGGCLVPVASTAPTFTEESCDSANPGTSFSGSYTLPSVDHVHYEVQVNSAAAVAVLAGTYPVSPGDVVTVTVLPDTGYIISPVPNSASLTHTYHPALSCLVTSTPIQPDATSQSCVPAGSGGTQGQLSTASSTDVLTDAFITIPNTTGVQYFVNQKAYGPGKLILPPGVYTVTAQAKIGYTLDTSSYPVGGWVETLTSAEPCGDLITHPLVDPSATQVQLGCFSSGSYALSNDLSDPAAINWTVNGSPVSQGTFTVSAPGTYTVHAEANGPTYGLETGAQQDWTFVFALPTTCDLKTLALTGSSPTGWLGLGYLMLVSGLALIAVRFVRRRGEQL
jgi:hypothetical protein